MVLKQISRKRQQLIKIKNFSEKIKIFDNEKKTGFLIKINFSISNFYIENEDFSLKMDSKDDKHIHSDKIFFKFNIII